MPRVEIYTKMFCPYCARATRLLSGKGAAYEEYDITFDGAQRSPQIMRNGVTELIQFAGHSFELGGSFRQGLPELFDFA